LKRVEVFVGEKAWLVYRAERRTTRRKPCGSELAREEGVSVNIDVD